MNQLDELIPDAPRAPSTPVILYGEVGSVNPLVITVDGDEDPLEIEPSTSVDGIIPGDRVMMTLQNDELIVTGIIDGDVDYIEEFMEGIAVAQDEASTALTAATTAITSANGKNKVYHCTSAELASVVTPFNSGDIWFDTENGNRPHVHNGDNWVVSLLGDAAIGNLDVGKLTGDVISGNFVIAGGFRAETEMGGRVEIDPAGIRNYDGADQLVTSLNTDGTSTFRGQVEASGVEVLGKLKFHGSDSEVAAGARLNITGGVTPPGATPNIYPEWLTVTLSGVPKTYITGVTRDPANGDWIVSSADLTGTPTVTRHNATTGALVATVGTFPAIANGTYPDGGGLAYADGTYWAPRYIKTVESFKTYGVFQIVALTGSARTLTPKTEMGFAYFDDFATIGSTGNTGQIAIRLKDHARSTDIRRLVLYTTSTSTRTVDVAEPTGVGGFWYSGAVAHHTFDFGVARFGMIAPAGLAKFHDPTAGAEDTPRGFGTGRSNIAQGFGYYGGSMWSSDSGKCYIYDGPNEADVEFAATWYDSTAAGTGEHETALGPSGYSQTGIKRARLRVHPPLLTTTPGDDGVNSVRIYARVGGSMRLQGTFSTPGASLLITGALASGTIHGSVADFPATDPGSIENSTGDIVLPGNGPAQLKTINIPRILTGETIDELPAGLYMPGDDSLITTGRGYPFPNVLGVLEILGSALGTGDVHRYTTFEASPRIALRSRVGGSWSAWTQIGGSVARPRAQGVITTSKSMPSGTTTITGWTESYDIGSGFNPSTGAYVVPAGQGGLWSIGMGLTFGTQSTRRAIGIAIGGTWLWREEGPATGYSELSFARNVELAAGATLQPRLYCAAAVSIRGDQNGGAYFQVRRVE